MKKSFKLWGLSYVFWPCRVTDKIDSTVIAKFQGYAEKTTDEEIGNL